jgi:hypothetical protein
MAKVLAIVALRKASVNSVYVYRDGNMIQAVKLEYREIYVSY